jgi:hypothetical protein
MRALLSSPFYVLLIYFSFFISFSHFLIVVVTLYLNLYYVSSLILCALSLCVLSFSLHLFLSLCPVFPIAYLLNFVLYFSLSLRFALCPIFLILSLPFLFVQSFLLSPFFTCWLQKIFCCLIAFVKKTN